MNISEIIKELNSKIKEKYSDFRGSYLFGSYARGDYNEDSDMDIVAIFDEINWDKEMDIHGICTDLDYKYNIIISLLPYTYPRLKKNYVFHNEVVNKGVYYEAT
jgi:uncharacterized protein